MSGCVGVLGGRCVWVCLTGSEHMTAVKGAHGHDSNT